MIDEGGWASASGESFKTQGAGAGEEVEAAATGQVVRQPVKEGFAGACRCRAYAAGFGEAQFAAALVAADDAEFAAVAGWTGFLGARHGDKASRAWFGTPAGAGCAMLRRFMGRVTCGHHLGRSVC